MTAPAQNTAHLAALLKTLALSGMLHTLDARLAQAAAGDLGFLEFLQTLCLDEIDRREAGKHQRLTQQARFTLPGASIETFDMTADPGIPAAQIRDLAALGWLNAGQHLIITGPVGSGKTHTATALARQAIRSGHSARFTTTSRLLADLAGGHADGTWAKRLTAYTRPSVLVLDDWAMRELTAPQADDLYELVTERTAAPKAGSIILTTNRQACDWYPLFPNAVVAESLFDRIVNNAHHLPITAPSYRARKRPTP